MAFQGTYERDEQGNPTEDALTGALLEWEYQRAMISWMRAWEARNSARAAAERKFRV